MGPVEGYAVAHQAQRDTPMTPNALGTFIRERRFDLGLTQEQLAERVGPTVRQAEISRLERGQVVMPRRQKMEHIAAALDVTLGDLLHSSGWLTNDEADDLAFMDSPVETTSHMREEMTALRETLQLAVERIEVMESRMRVDA